MPACMYPWTVRFCVLRLSAAAGFRVRIWYAVHNGYACRRARACLIPGCSCADRLLGFVRGKEFLVSRALGMPCCPQLGLLHALRLRGGQNGFEENDAAPRGVGKHKERHSRSGRMRLEHKVTGRVSQESHPGRRRSRPGPISGQCVPSLRAQRVERQRWCGLGRRRPRGREHGTGEGIPESAAEEFRAAQDSLIERERSVFQRKVPSCTCFAMVCKHDGN